MSATERTRTRQLNTQRLTIVAQDPSVRVGRRILTAEVEIPAEELLPGPRGYRVSVIDYDSSANVIYEPAVLTMLPRGGYDDPYAAHSADHASAKQGNESDRRLLDDPRFHAQNVYAIIMRTLARFEFALGRRVAWGCDGHQIHVAPHAFAEPNAFYSREHRGIFFGYFTGASGKPVYTCLSHDVVAHETTHAILDGLRARFLEPSSPDQAAFHEAFADVVALLSVFSLPGIVGAMLDRSAGGAKLIDEKHLTRDALLNSALFGLAEQMGGEISGARGQALRRSVKLERGVPYQDMEEFQEEHRRGELLVAAFLNGLVDIWLARLEKIGSITRGKRDRSIVVEEAARVAEHLLTMAIRAIDYCPPTDLTFSDYLSALLTIDREVVPDDTKYGYRKSLLENFAGFGIRPAHGAGEDGAWQRNDRRFVYTRTHFDSMLRDKEEMFRFLWENRRALEIDEVGYLEVQSVRPSIRIGPDGFVLRETVAEYVHIVTMKAEELETELGIVPPHEIPRWRRLRVFGGGALLFDEYGQLKYHIANHIRRSAEDRRRQTRRLEHLFEAGFFDRAAGAESRFSALHLARATS